LRLWSAFRFRQWLRKIEQLAFCHDDDFDPVFYRQNNGDLFHLTRAKELHKHYRRHGAKEGRAKNLAAAQEAYEHRFGPLPSDFDSQIYRFLNEDLARIFTHDWQFAFHYLEYGRKEGRRYNGISAVSGPGELWQNLFHTYDFIACATDWLAPVPSSRVEAIQRFINEGIDRLAPINLSLIFDPNYYRENYYPRDTRPASDLYQEWLTSGVPIGHFPNEEIALRHLIGETLFPRAFDWVEFQSSLPNSIASSLKSRVQVLQYFLEQNFNSTSLAFIRREGGKEFFASIGHYHWLKQHYQQALIAYDIASNSSEKNWCVLLRRGEIHAALGNKAAALNDFKEAGAYPEASVWSHIRAVEIALDKEAFDEAFVLLKRARPLWIKDINFRKTIAKSLDRLFDVKTALALALYATSQRMRADVLMMETLQTIKNRMIDLEDFPPPLTEIPNGHIVMLANLELPQCVHYRVEQKRQQLEYAGYRVEIHDEKNPQEFISGLIGARAAIFYRVPATPPVLRAILTAKALAIPVYYDLDDLLFEADNFPDAFSTYEGQITYDTYYALMLGVPLYRYAITQCDFGITSTTPIAARIAPLVAKADCLVLRNGLDQRNDKFIAKDTQSLSASETITIFYGSGTKAHNSDFNHLAGAALLTIMDKYPHVRLVIAGYLQLRPEFKRFEKRITQAGFINDLDAYWTLLSSCDINIASLSPSPMTDCKSEIKWLEAAILGIPSVLSRTGTFEEVLEEGVDAILVDDVAGWIVAFENLIENRHVRLSIGVAAREKALANYSLTQAAKTWRDHFDLSNNKQEIDPAYTVTPSSSHSGRKRRILICNVFFAPQSYGGATRVVMNNVDYILESCPDLELAIFTTDDGIQSAGLVRLDQYRGIAVYRLSTPIEPLRDWHPFNPHNIPAFEKVLNAFQPDLVHFHCIQRLTASIVKATQNNNIPYLITAHDAWWISDHQFLIDEDGRLCMPDNEPKDHLPKGILPLASIERRASLSALMSGAVNVLAVSPSFAEIYKRAGANNVVSIPNGVPPITCAPHIPRPDHRLALGHMGGRELHKGAPLIEAVLRTNSFSNFHLTMIDTSLEPGTMSEQLWGTTPVTLRGPFPQDQVAGLYASLDVLIAPSIWPESFGLVAREALAQGLWVVASDRGAMAENVRTDENGFVINVENGQALKEILRKLDSNPRRYQQRLLSGSTPQRTATDQAKEIIEIYRKISTKMQ